MPKPKFKSKRRKLGARNKISSKYNIPSDTKIDYKNVTLIQKFLNERGKIMPRRITGVSAKNQRLLSTAIKQARFLALLTSGSVK